MHTRFRFGKDYAACGLMRRRILDRTWTLGRCYLGMPTVFGAIQIHDEKISGSRCYLGMPVVFFCGAP